MLVLHKMGLKNLQTLCSIYKVVLHCEIVFSIVATVMAIGKTQGLSILGLILFLLLIALPQYIIIEIGLKNS